MATIDIGKISFTQKGNYDNSTSYAPKDVVQHTDQNETSSFVKINSTATSISIRIQNSISMQFKCEFCDHRCSQNSKLIQHVASVHEGKKPFECRICESKFKSKQASDKHMASIHEGKKP